MDYISLLPFDKIYAQPIRGMWLMCRNKSCVPMVKRKQSIATRHLHLELVRTFSVTSDRNPNRTGLIKTRKLLTHLTGKSRGTALGIGHIRLLSPYQKPLSRHFLLCLSPLASCSGGIAPNSGSHRRGGRAHAETQLMSTERAHRSLSNYRTSDMRCCV